MMVKTPSTRRQSSPERREPAEDRSSTDDCDPKILILDDHKGQRSRGNTKFTIRDDLAKKEGINYDFFGIYLTIRHVRPIYVVAKGAIAGELERRIFVRKRSWE
jgi:hypothetical protein